MNRTLNYCGLKYKLHFNTCFILKKTQKSWSSSTALPRLIRLIGVQTSVTDELPHSYHQKRCGVCNQGIRVSLANDVRAFLTFVPSTLGRSAVTATRRRGVSTCRTLLKPRSMLPRTLRAELGVSFCAAVPSVLKKSKRSTQLTAKITLANMIFR